MATRDAFLSGGATAETGNPFSGSGVASTALTIAQPQVGFQARLPNGQNILFASEADYLKAKEFLATQSQNVPVLGGSGGSSGGTSDLIGMAAEAFQGVSGFLAGSRYSQLLSELQDARDALATARDALAKDPGANPQMLNALSAMQDYQDAGINVLNAQITAVDMAAGGETAKVISRFVGGGGNGLMGGGLGTTVAVGAAGLGMGLLLSNNNSTRRR